MIQVSLVRYSLHRKNSQFIGMLVGMLSAFFALINNLGRLSQET